MSTHQRKSAANIANPQPPGPAPNIKTASNDSAKRLKLLVTNWILQVSLRGNVPLDKVKDLTTLFQELKDGIMLCKILNILHPGAVQQLNDGQGAIPALENLSKFAGGCTAYYGVDRKYMFRPLDFFNQTPKGEEGMTVFLAALAIRASEKGYTVNFPVMEAKELLDACIKESETAANYAKVKNNELLSPVGLASSMDSLQSPKLEGKDSIKTPANSTLRSKVSHSANNIASTPASQANTPLPNPAPLAAPSSASPHTASSSNFSQDPAIVLPKLQRKLDKLERNQRLIVERVDSAIKNSYPKIAENIRANYEACVRRLMTCEISQKDLMETFLEQFLTGTGIDFEGEPVEKRELNENQSPSSQISMSPGSASPQKAAFNKLPQEIVNAGLPKQELMRLSVVYEMIETEQDFARDLTFHKVQMKQSKMLSDEDIAILFSNTEELVSVSQSFHDKMNERKTANAFITEIGDIIAECSESLKAYSTYCSNYPTAMQMVHGLSNNPEIKNQLQAWMNAPECRGLSLESFLIKPIQRICKYPLLLKELLRHTEKTHKDYANLQLASEKIDSVVKVANEATAILGERDRLASIQAKIDSSTPISLQDKKLYKDGNCNFSKQNKKPAERYVVVCGDLLIVCKILRPRYQLDTMYYLSDLSLKGGESPAPMTLQQQLQLQPKSKYSLTISVAGQERNTFTLHCVNEEECKKWTDAITDAIKANPPEPSRTVRSNKRTSMGPGGANTFGKMNKFGQNLLNRIATNQSFEGSGVYEEHQELEVTVPEEPEMVEWEGQYLKKAMAATGQIYFFNIVTKDTRWKLPDGYVVVDAVTLKPIDLKPKLDEADEENEDSFEFEADDEGMNVEPYGQNWRKVSMANGVQYYFHSQTMETSWAAPVLE